MNKKIFYIEPEQYVEIRKWCIENFGPSYPNTWTLLANNAVGGDVFFTNEEDAMAFKLRWL